MIIFRGVFRNLSRGGCSVPGGVWKPPEFLKSIDFNGPRGGGFSTQRPSLITPLIILDVLNFSLKRQRKMLKIINNVGIIIKWGELDRGYRLKDLRESARKVD